MCDGSICLILLSLSKIPSNQYSTFTPTPIQIDVAFIKVVMGNDRETAVKAFSLSRATNALSIRL